MDIFALFLKLADRIFHGVRMRTYIHRASGMSATPRVIVTAIARHASR